MSKSTVYNYVRQTPTNIVEELYNTVGASFTLGNAKRAFLGSTFVLRRTSGGTPLVDGVDYELDAKDVFYSAAPYEGEDVFTQVNILNATYETGDLYVTYDVVFTYASTSAIIDLIYPVGCYYTQYPDAASNDDATEFPTAQEPESLFGGTWAEQWATESIYFRTRGTDADDGRTDGLQLDQMQKITGSLSASVGTVGLVADAGGVSGAFSLGTERSLRLGTGSGTSYDTAFDSADSPDARASTDTDGETRVTNRRIKVWKRTA